MSLQKLSESVYVGLCLKFGTTEEVKCRREAHDITELVLNKSMRVATVMLSGSTREGFLFKGSDRDIMFWNRRDKVFWDIPQSRFYNKFNHKLILCDTSESPPGFVLLKMHALLYATLKDAFSCVELYGTTYISSAKYREIMPTADFPGSQKIHGPCLNLICLITDSEFDFADCFFSDYWPPLAFSWISRSHAWPPLHVVSDIISGGCHFVAIGHKLGKHMDNEWRISFSQAEYKLVYSMNHTQFLTYGLLKLFLKEVINNGLNENEKLLCSYHMKTAIFWAIQQNTILDWSPQNLLACFWVCFKLLLKWVYEGVCPNFFIPENNMFLSNIHGDAQKKLFRRLYRLYEKGTALLLQSPSIRPYIMNVLFNPRTYVCTDEHTLISEFELDLKLFNSIGLNISFLLGIRREVLLTGIELLIKLPLSQYQSIMLQRLTATIFQLFVFYLHTRSINTLMLFNKRIYTADKLSCSMLKLTAKFGCISDKLFFAMYLYKTCRYSEAISILGTIKMKLLQPSVIYNGRVFKAYYTEAVGGHSLSTKMREAIAESICIENTTCYIQELQLEQYCSLHNRHVVLGIPSPVLLFMLEFLCYRHVDPVRAPQALEDLHSLVHLDKGFYTSGLHDISFEILGICQHISGHFHAALFSYQESLRQEPTNQIQSATRHRIQSLYLSAQGRYDNYQS